MERKKPTDITVVVRDLSQASFDAALLKTGPGYDYLGFEEHDGRFFLFFTLTVVPMEVD